MRKLALFLFLLAGIGSSQAEPTYNPKAAPKAVVTSGRARFTVLTPQMIRIQYSTNSMFEDRATFAVVNRNLPVPNFKTKEENGYLYITTDALTLKYKIGSVINPSLKSSRNLSVSFKMNGQNVLWYPGKEDAMNLKGTCRTLDQNIDDQRRTDLEDGIISRTGWAIIDESPTAKRGDGSTTFALQPNSVAGFDWYAQPVDKNAIDYYFMGYGHDYKQALGDFVKIGGKIPMPPLYMFGYWYSRYWKYTAQDFQDIVNEATSKDIPMDIMIFDMGWHTDNDWTGWTWDKNVIPNPRGLIAWMHNKNLKVALNLHPANGISNWEAQFEQVRNDLKLPASTTNIPWQLQDPTFYKVFFKDVLYPMEKEGVDFWWLDWQQELTNKFEQGLGNTFWCNHVFYNDMKQNRTDERAVIYHRWGGMGSHRYPIGFSGDSFASFGTLAFQPYFTSTASNVGWDYWGHDLGGHQWAGNEDGNDPELYLRWMQFGAFTPIYRTHATEDKRIERRIWKFSNFELLRSTDYLRYQMLPYIYTAARKTYDEGIGICRPLYYDNPEENNAYRYENEYMFGDDILVSPIVERAGSDGMATQKAWLPAGLWWNVSRNQLVEGGKEFTDKYSLAEIPYFFKAGSIIVNNPKINNTSTRPDTLILKVVPGGNGETSLYEDEGNTNAYENGAFATTHIQQTRNAGAVTVTIDPRVGRFPGMKEARSYKVQFLGEAKPEAISINGEQLADDKWSYDETTKTVSVSTPKLSCDEAIKVVMKQSTTGIDDVTAGQLTIEYDAATHRLVGKSGVGSKAMRLIVNNMQGATASQASTASANSIAIDLSNLSSGTYICRLVAGKSVMARKIVVD